MTNALEKQWKGAQSWMKKRGKGLKQLVHAEKENKENDDQPAPESAPPESALSMPTADTTKEAEESPKDMSPTDSDEAPKKVSYHGEEMWA